MTHNLRIEHRAIEGLLSSTAGGLLVGALLQKSWWMGLVSVLVATALLLIERRDLEEEEKPIPVVVKGLVLSDEVVTALQKTASRKFTDSAEPSYSDGLHDGGAITAQFVLGSMKEESE